MLELWIFVFFLQAFHAVFRTTAIHATAKGNLWIVIITNMFANLLRISALVMGIMGAIKLSPIFILAFVFGQGIGDFIAIKYFKQV